MYVCECWHLFCMGVQATSWVIALHTDCILWEHGQLNCNRNTVFDTKVEGTQTEKHTTWGPIITEQKRQNTTKDSFWLVHQNGGQYQQQQHGDLLKPCSAVKKGYATAFNNVDKQKVNFYDRWRGKKVLSNIHFPYTQNQWHKQQLTKEGFGESFS